jgi:hypothetical protein
MMDKDEIIRTTQVDPYPMTGNKPHDILFDGAKCIWYENETDPI